MRVKATCLLQLSDGDRFPRRPTTLTTGQGLSGGALITMSEKRGDTWQSHDISLTKEQVAMLVGDLCSRLDLTVTRELHGFYDVRDDGKSRSGLDVPQFPVHINSRDSSLSITGDGCEWEPVYLTARSVNPSIVIDKAKAKEIVAGLCARFGLTVRENRTVTYEVSDEQE